MVEAGAASGTTANHLAAIRTAFDKFCLRDVTFGLVVPRRSKRLIEVLNDGRPIYLTGTRALEVRPGFVTLEIPPLEAWSEPLTWLTPAQRERIGEPEFYEMLQGEITRRLVSLPPPTA
jgi:hypothetical protein